MAYQQIHRIRVFVATASAAAGAAVLTGLHMPAAPADGPPNGDCAGAIYCVTGGADPWVPFGPDPMAPWGTNASPGPYGVQPNLPF